LADRLGALLIADEAQTGMGRTGRWFGVNHDDVTPDVLVLAKGVGGGFPSSVVVTTDAVNDAVMTRANQFSSHQSDPLGAVATAAVIDIIETDGLVARSAAVGQVLRERLGEIGARRGHLVNVRGRGLMIGFDVFRDAGRPVVEPDLGRGIEDFCRARGVNFEVIQRNRFRILPPLTISDEEIDRFLTVLDEAMAAIDRGSVRPLPAANTWTTGYEQRLKRERGLKSIAKWAWNHSPSEWIGQVQQLARKAGSRG